MQIFNETRNTCLIDQGRVADTFFSRLQGLLGSPPLQKNEGLILVGEKSIHTFFMTFPIDVVYVDKNYKVIRTDINMVPYRLGPFLRRSAYVLEVPVGTIADTATNIGDQLTFKE
ncbi:MAG: DUF192 domain-containing protein [Chloroflexota bacterium]